VFEFVLLARPEPALARREASRARRWCFKVTELAGEVLRGRGCPRLESSTFPEDSGIIGSDIACSLYVWNRESSDNSCCLCQVWCGCWPIARWRQVSCASRLLLDVGVLLDPGCDVRATTLKGVTIPMHLREASLVVNSCERSRLCGVCNKGSKCVRSKWPMIGRLPETIDRSRPSTAT
jgi:hypothetical protein